MFTALSRLWKHETNVVTRDEELFRLEGENEARYHELRVLNEVGLTILQSRDIETIGGQVLDACMALGPYDLGNIFLRDPTADSMVPIVSRGFQDPAKITARPIAVNDARADDADRPRRRYRNIVSQKPRIIEDVQLGSGFARLKAEGARGVIYAPLLAEGEVLGVLQLATRVLRRFQPSEVAFIESLGHQLGIAIQKARLQDEALRAQTEQKTIEDARERLAAILEATTDIVTILRADGQRIFLNRAGRKLLGIEEHEVDGSEVGGGDRPAWATRQLLDEAIPTAVHNGTWMGETAFLGADGKEIPFSQLVIAHQDESGSVQFLSTIERDITMQKEAEHQRETSAQTEKLRALGQMAHGIAHDLNQCLALVAGHTELARRALPDENPSIEAARSSLDIVLQAARDGADSVKRLQSYGQPAAGDAPTKLALGTLLQEVASLTSPVWKDAARQRERQIDLRVDVDEDSSIEGSPSELREAFTNLVLNAVDALPDGGTINLRAHRRRDRVDAEVQDSGVGMAPEVRARIFEPFFTTKGRRGLGLGLSMVLSTLERHDARVDVESEPGQGTTFRLSFPWVALPPEPRAANETAGPVHALKILAVDDEPEIAQMVCWMLEPIGHKMAMATSGEDALERLSTEPFDIVISDIRMEGGMSGWELAEEVHRRFPPVRVILASGWAQDRDPRDPRARGVETVISKPFRIEELEQVVHSPLQPGSTREGNQPVPTAES